MKDVDGTRELAIKLRSDRKFLDLIQEGNIGLMKAGTIQSFSSCKLHNQVSRP
jgi:hypothetical protein